MKPLAALFFVSACFLLVYPPQTPSQNPHHSPQDAAAGGRIFRSHCAECHGVDGTGGRGADLARGQFRHGESDAALFNTISNGVPGTEMPGTFFQGQQVWQLVAFVRSLAGGSARTAARGDPVAGEALFRGKGGCTQCHMVSGQGGRLGPDLSDVGGTRSPQHLSSSVLRPSQDVLPQHWTARVVTKDGKSIAGRRLNEDTLSLQILDSKENLVALVKSELAEYEIDKASSMPPYEGVLSDAEVSDLVAYLATLRKERRSR